MPSQFDVKPSRPGSFDRRRESAREGRLPGRDLWRAATVTTLAPYAVPALAPLAPSQFLRSPPEQP